MDKIIFWTPRILMIFFILFISLFALDSFEGDKTLIDKIGGFVVHLVPTFLLILLLILSWKREWIGAIAFLLLGISYIIMAWGKFPISTYFIISGPLVLISILFAWGWVVKKNAKQN